MKGHSQYCSIHSAIWKFFLVVSPKTQDKYVKPSDWLDILSAERSRYRELQKQFCSGVPKDIESDPLAVSDHKSDEWNIFFKDQELRSHIALDTTRAFPEEKYFQDPDVLKTLEDLIFIFCKTHPAYGYPQGLHELAAYIMLVFHNEMTSSGTDIISQIFAKTEILADSYSVFEKLAEAIEPFYRAGNAPGEAGYCAELANRIQNNDLARHNRRLSETLCRSSVAPQAYMLNWLRLLFLRVFDATDVKPMWDLIFAHLPNLDVISNTCIALLLSAQNRLLKFDSTEILHFLFHYPPVPNPSRFVITAIEMTCKSEVCEVDATKTATERLSAIAAAMTKIATECGYTKIAPLISELERTKDVLTGQLPAENLLPLELSLEIFNSEVVLEDEPSDEEEPEPEPVPEPVKPVAAPVTEEKLVQEEPAQSNDLFPSLKKAEPVGLFGEIVPKAPKQKVSLLFDDVPMVTKQSALPEEPKGLLFEETAPKMKRKKPARLLK